MRARILTPLQTDGRLAVVRKSLGPAARLTSEKMGQLGDRKLTHKLLTKSCANGASCIAPPKARKSTLIWVW